MLDELSAEADREIDEHLDSCVQCVRILDTYYRRQREEQEALWKEFGEQMRLRALVALALRALRDKWSDDPVLGKRVRRWEEGGREHRRPGDPRLHFLRHLNSRGDSRGARPRRGRLPIRTRGATRVRGVPVTGITITTERDPDQESTLVVKVRGWPQGPDLPLVLLLKRERGAEPRVEEAARSGPNLEARFEGVPEGDYYVVLEPADS